MGKNDVVKYILRHTNHNINHIHHQQFIGNDGSAWAPSNVALCKYWGKRDQELNLPVTSSLSISLGNKGAFTKIKYNEHADSYIVNGTIISQDSKFALRLKKFLDLFRPHGVCYLVEVDTNVPIAAGLASSACGFASLVLALNKLYDWQLSKKELSILARLGSGSACRSLYDGFVEWQRGESADGMDSYGTKLEYIWPELRIGVLTIAAQEKFLSSREAMQYTMTSSPLYYSWPEQLRSALANIKLALAHKDFNLLGLTAENNACSMHALMYGARPPIVYSLPETLAAIAMVQETRLSGIPVYFTQDAGPNIQLLFLAKDESAVLSIFPQMEMVLPFADSHVTQIVLVDDNDVKVGAIEKLAAHIQGKLHRAFSVMILRRRNNSLELLLQQRSSTKYHSANLWSNTCCGHPKPGENIIMAAEKRLREEMGFGVPLKEIGQFHYRAKLIDTNLIENEIDHVLIGFSDLEILPFNIEEVQDYCWIEIAQLKQDLLANPNKYTVWLPLVLEVIDGLFLA